MKKSEDRSLHLESIAGIEVLYRHCGSGCEDCWGKILESVVMKTSAEGQSSMWAEVPVMINVFVRFS
jgi:hypothetical protein